MTLQILWLIQLNPVVSLFGYKNFLVDCVALLFQASGHRIGFDVLDKLGLSDVKARIYELIKKAKDLKIDVYEYACLKFLILLNPGKA